MVLDRRKPLSDFVETVVESIFELGASGVAHVKDRRPAFANVIAHLLQESLLLLIGLLKEVLHIGHLSGRAVHPMGHLLEVAGLLLRFIALTLCNSVELEHLSVVEPVERLAEISHVSRLQLGDFLDRAFFLAHGPEAFHG